MKKIPIMLLLTAPALLAPVVLIHCGTAENYKPPVHNPPIQVKVEPISLGSLIQSINYKGGAYPWKRAIIAPEAPGRIIRIHKKNGDRVMGGTLVAELDSASARLASIQAKAALSAAKASFNDASQNHERFLRLFEEKVATQTQLEKSALALEAAKMQLQGAQSYADLMEHNLNNCFLRAPFDGFVSSCLMTEGDIINPLMNLGAPPGIMEIIDIQKVKILLDVPSEEIDRICPGQTCAVSVNNLPNEFFTGEVASKSLSADMISKTFKVEVVVNNPEFRIKPGVFANVRVEIARKDRVLLLPVNALLIERDVQYVVLYDNGVARYKNVRLGDKNGIFYEIIDGLSEGQLVVVEGNYDLLEKTPITYIADDV